MKFFSWFKQGSKDSDKWQEESQEREYVRKHVKEVRQSKLQDLRRYNNNKEDRLKL